MPCIKGVHLIGPSRVSGSPWADCPRVVHARRGGLVGRAVRTNDKYGDFMMVPATMAGLQDVIPKYAASLFEW